MAIKSALDPLSPLKLPYADYLRWIINDRGQLKQLDYTVAQLVAQKLTGSKSVKAFRYVPYRKIRNKWKLPSLVVMRNRYGKRRRPGQPGRQVAQAQEVGPVLTHDPHLTKASSGAPFVRLDGREALAAARIGTSCRYGLRRSVRADTISTTAVAGRTPTGAGSP